MTSGRLFRAGNKDCLVPRVFRTSNFLERMRGLLGKPHLAPGEALLIHPCSSVHTIGMRYTIDLAFLDRQLTIIKTVKSLKPWRMASCPAASMVLETAEGGLGEMRLAEGMKLEWQES